MAQWVEHVLWDHEDLSLDPWQLLKSWAQWHTPIMPALGTETGGSQGLTVQPGSLAYQQAPGLVTDCISESKVGGLQR